MTLNVAVIGVGSMGCNHARVYSEIGGVNLVAVCDINEKAGKDLASKFDCKYYSDYKELAGKENIDAVSIVVPTKLHFEVADFFINRKIHVMVEKPITHTIEEGKRLIENAKKNSVKLMVGHIERYNPAIRALKKELDNNKLGKVYKINAKRVGPFPERVRDVGVVIDLAVHDLDIMRYLTGSEAKSVFAEVEQQIHTKHEDLLVALLRFENKMICELNVDWLTPTKIREICISGERGMFLADTAKQELYFYENALLKDKYEFDDFVKGVIEGDTTKIKIEIKEPLKAELEEFINCIIDDKVEPITGEDGIKALELALNILKSSKENKVVNI